ncbi:RhoGAP domain-containing protein [Colletotrichum truncatum]|uniref:RhoGAP domain-containing protein n=1 Tax=Colletotrichum truncatum TaxID=5467 RepID=A0ACC3ZHZ2_COLTU|nr:RhoGAP domain-containing protein [Colletotrichum truncatum]KAF6786745.1 RhoGAP domain-containing protein [Colletotrichum truncatum]
MQTYRQDPSASSVTSKDPETGTIRSQLASTAPTSTLPSQPPLTCLAGPLEPKQSSLINSSTLPALDRKDGRHNRVLPSSATWTSSSADLNLFPDTDETQDRQRFVQEYNRLAKKHGIRVLVVEDFERGRPELPITMSEKRRWWSRVFRSPSSGPTTRGIFRIPGSLRVVNAIFDYYCYDRTGEDVTSTIRCPSLPLHINAGAHDVASAFKKLLSVLPGGILGSLSLFDAFVAIQSQLRGEPELSRTKETKLRARLIALAISTTKSLFRRELICAVFGLLSVIGRAAEMTAREDEQGRPLPTSDLMGYTALGIVFGPLLVGDLIDSYTMKVATPSSGLLLFPLTPPQLKRERQRKGLLQEDTISLPVDKVHVANNIAEMLIANWREVVRNMKNLTKLPGNDQGAESASRRMFLRSSGSGPVTIGLPKGWRSKQSSSGISMNREGSPAPDTPTPASRTMGLPVSKTSGTLADKLEIKRCRPKVSRSASSNRLSLRQSLNPLSPTAEETSTDSRSISKLNRPITHSSHVATAAQPTINKRSGGKPGKPLPISTPKTEKSGKLFDEIYEPRSFPGQHSPESPRVSYEFVPARSSSKWASKDLQGATEANYKQSPRRSGVSSPRSSNESNEKGTALDSFALHQLAMGNVSGTSSSGSPTEMAPERTHLSPENVSPRTIISLKDEGFLSLTHKKTATRSTNLAEDEDFDRDKSPSRMRTPTGSGSILTSFRGSETRPSGVKAMAAMFEVASKDSQYVPSPMATRQPRANKLVTSLSNSMTNTPSPKSLKLARSAWSLGKVSIKQRSQSSDGSSKTKCSSQKIQRIVMAENVAHSAEKPNFGRLRRAPNIQSHQKAPTEAPAFNEDRNPPTLGTMVSPAEQPPIAQHVNFPRPPSSSSIRQPGEELIPQRPGSPGGNSLLHAQTRTLQRQLDAKTEEAASLRRQLETRENVDVGILSEQLRSAKRECAMWKGRAEAAEKRVAALERFTRRLRNIKGGDAQDDVDSLSAKSRGSRETTGTEDEELVASRIRTAFMDMNGIRNVDGGASAWWNERRSGNDSRVDKKQHAGMTEQSAMLKIAEAVQKLLADEGLE